MARMTMLRRTGLALAALGMLMAAVACSNQERAGTVSVAGVRGDGPAPAATAVPPAASRTDGSQPTPVPTTPPPPPTATPAPTVAPELVAFQIPETVTNDRLATANADPAGLAEAYLNFRLRSVDLTIGDSVVSVSPGEPDIAHTVTWEATSQRGDSSGVVLVRSSGTGDFWVSEALTDGVELADLSLTVEPGENELQGFIRSESPFAVELFTVLPDGQRSAVPIEETVGQLEVQREAAPGAWFALRVTDKAAEPLHVTELTTFHDAQTAPQTSMLQQFRNESIDRWVIRFGGGPSQTDAQAEQRGVAPAIAALPLSSRLDLGARVAFGDQFAEVGRNDRWVVSRLPFDVEQELRNAGSIIEPGPLVELLRLGGGDTQPLSLQDSIPLGGLRPSWIRATASAVYAGRIGASASFVVRLDTATGAVVALAGPDVQPGIPSGWAVASREQLDLIGSLDEDNLDLSVIDHLVTLPPLR